jgi:hypothetical protein
MLLRLSGFLILNRLPFERRKSLHSIWNSFETIPISVRVLYCVLLDRRLAALEQAGLDRRKGWENQLKSLSDNIRELESDSQRTARGSSIVR